MSDRTVSAGIESHSAALARSEAASLPGWGAAVLPSTLHGKRPGHEDAHGRKACTAELKQGRRQVSKGLRGANSWGELERLREGGLKWDPQQRGVFLARKGRL